MVEGTGGSKTGYLGTLTEQQKEVFEALKTEVAENEVYQSIWKHPQLDRYLLRFLRATMKNKRDARNFVLEPALSRLRQVTAWKEEHSIAYDMERPGGIELFDEIYPYFGWLDRKAKVLCTIERFGKLHSNLNKNHLSEDLWQKNIGYRMEDKILTIDRFSEEIGEEVPGYDVIADLKGARFFSIIRRLKHLMFLNNVGAQNYPELINKIILVNAPRFVNELILLARSFVDPDTMRKFESHTNIPDSFADVYESQKLPREYKGDSEVVVPIPKDAL